MYKKSMKKQILRSHKYRLYPNQSQKALLAKIFGTVRFTYNFFLEECKNNIFTQSDCTKRLSILKTEKQWLNETDPVALEYSIKHLFKAFDNFKHGISNYPSYHLKRSKQSYTTWNRNISLSKKHINLPFLGNVKCSISSKLTGKIINATISKNPDNRYFVSLLCDEIYEPFPKTGKTIGIDKGIKDLIVTSDGMKKTNPHFQKKLQKKLKREQRKLSRKIHLAKSSNKDIRKMKNIAKQRVKVAKIYSKINNQKMDFLHKLSTEIIKNYDIICVENLNVKKMLKNQNFSYNISNASWSTFQSMLNYKAKWNNRTIVKISQYYPSSQKCSNCGYINTPIKKTSIRTWACPHCHSIHDRDINAAINIQKEGLRLINKSGTPG